HRHQLQLVVAVARREVPEAVAERREVAQPGEPRAGRIGRRHRHDGLDEPTHLDHRLRVLVVGFGVEPRVPRNLAPRLPVVVRAPQVVAVGHRRKRAVERQNLEPMLREFQLADDLGPQQRHDVRADRELEAGEDLFGDRGAAEHMAPFEHQHLPPGPPQVRGRRQPVMATADDDGVVFGGHSPLTIADCRTGDREIVAPSRIHDPAILLSPMPVPTPLHERTFPLCTSLNYRDWAGYYAVSAYETHHEHEYNAIRNGAALIDISPLFKYMLRGPDATRLVDRIITRSAAKMRIGQVYYTPWCDERGHVIDDGTVTRLDEQWYRWTAAEPNLRWISENARGLDVEIEDASERIAAVALQGPTSAALLFDVADADIASLKYFRMTSGTIAGARVDISRTGYTG